MAKSHLLREDVAYYNPFVNGATFTDVTLQAAITALGSTRQTLAPPTGTWTLAANITTPATLDLWIAAGTLLTVNTGVILTLNGGFEAPPVRVFSGGGTVVFGPKTARVYPQWWGATGDGSTDDTVALQAACASGKHVWLPRGTYLHGSPLFLVSGSVLEGEGATSIIKAGANYGDQPQIQNSTNASTLGARDTNIRLAHFTLDGNRTNNGTGTGNAPGMHFVAVNGLRIEDVIVKETKGNAIECLNASTAAIYPENVRITRTTCTGITGNGIHFISAFGAVIDANLVTGAMNGIFVVLLNSGAVCQHVLIRGNEVRSCGSGASFYGIIAGATNTLIAYDIQILENILDTISGVGIGYANTDGLRIHGNQLRYLSLQGIHDSAGGAGNNARIQITGNIITQAGGSGIVWNGVQPAKIDGNILEATGTGDGGGGIYATGLLGGTISHNLIRSVAGHGLTLNAVLRSSLTGNAVTGVTGAGLVLAACLDCAVTGGAYIGNGTNGIIETGASNFNTIVGNGCRGNGGTSIVIVGAQTILVSNQT